jgi:hypothetical protein
MLHQRQPGDDDAAAFRLLLARPADETDDDGNGLATGDGTDHELHRVAMPCKVLHPT